MRTKLQAALDAGDFPGALDCCRERLNAVPEDADAHRHLAQLHAASGEPRLAMRHARRACELAPDDARAWSDLGRVYAQDGKLEDATRCFTEAIQIDPRYADGWHNLGTALETVAGVNQFSGVGPFAGRGSFGPAKTQMRGIGDNSFADREDGCLVPIFAARPDLAPYERIEVVKGPSSVLYGRGSAGGFVNRVRKRPCFGPRLRLRSAPSTSTAWKATSQVRPNLARRKVEIAPP